MNFKIILVKKVNIFILSLFILCINCTKKSTTNSSVGVVTPTPTNDVSFWLTKADQSVLLEKQNSILSFNTTINSNETIEVDNSQQFQTIDGFGFTLTGGSAYLINHMATTEKNNLLKELFATDSASIGISYLRLSIGASDLSASVFSYDDLAAGQTDINLDNFNLSSDTTDLIPILKKIIEINPNIKILASPWSAPIWMKDNNNSMGGGLQTQYYNAYAKYFVKYIQAMKANGIAIDAITIQNEPQHGGNNPSMVLSAQQEADFIKTSLGPAFQLAGVATKIIVWDHNCDNPNYPINVLSDAAAKPYINGSAFHLYAGNISALSTVHSAYPDKDVYFTEQWTGSTETFDGNLQWHFKNVIIGSMLNWSKNALEWNLANDANFGPHTPNGCTQCKGALTIIGSSVQRNESYYIIAHASKFVPTGSVRVLSSLISLPNVTFKTPNGKNVLLVLNEASAAKTFNIKFNGKWVTPTLPQKSVGTFIW